MEITLVSTVFPYPKKGVFVGIERFVDEYSQALLNKGYTVKVVTTFWNGGKEREEYNGIEIYRVGDSSLTFGKIGRLFDLHYYSFGKNVLRFKEVLEKADIIHALTPLSSTANLRKIAPLVSHFQHHEPIDKPIQLLYKPFHHIIEKKAYLKSDAVLAPSQYSKNVLCKIYSIPQEKVKVVPHGVDISKFSTTAMKKSKKIRLLFVGPLEERKGIKYLIEAFALVKNEHKNVELVLLGSGSQEKKLKELVNKLNLTEFVEFAGYIDGWSSDFVDYYNSSDIFVFPSLKEGFGMVIVEAMACGLPVISTNTSAIPEVVGDAGILVEPRNSQALVNAIILLIEDEKLRNKLSERGRKRVEENFTWEKVIERTLEAYSKLIRKR